MNDEIDCLRCHTRMEPGYIAAEKEAGGALPERWSPGVPRKSFWTGLKLDRKALVPVTTMRCPKCGALESYARPA